EPVGHRRRADEAVHGGPQRPSGGLGVGWDSVGPVSSVTLLYPFLAAAARSASRSNACRALTVNRTCRAVWSGRIESGSTHGRVARASATFAAQSVQTIAGTYTTTWLGPSVGSGAGGGFSGSDAHPAKSTRATAALVRFR